MSVGYITRTLVGRVRVPLVEVASAGAEGFRRLCPLMDEDYQVFREPRGEVELAINWVYDAEATSKSGFFQWATLKKKKVGTHTITAPRPRSSMSASMGYPGGSHGSPAMPSLVSFFII